jgi:hypothetical protein
MSDYYSHLKVGDYPQTFPGSVDNFPVFYDKRTFIDAWVLNYVYSILITIEQYLITNKATIEA